MNVTRITYPLTGFIMTFEHRSRVLPSLVHGVSISRPKTILFISRLHVHILVIILVQFVRLHCIISPYCSCQDPYVEYHCPAAY